ncbi:MAG: hypothetical protein CMJ46_03315 [Planctomyces sp.]|nr:hypothetical protein [Planctomyces sp.]
MENDPKDKYRVSGNIEAEYYDDNEEVLVNKQNIRSLISLQFAEEANLANAYEIIFSEIDADSPLTSKLICRIHECIFGSLFEWAGRWRTVHISKPGAIWPPPHYLDEAMEIYEQSVLARYPTSDLDRDADFCAAIGEIQGEFLAIHPFREGNARTIKLVSDIMASQTDRPILFYDSSPRGSEEYINAAKAALLRKDYSPMTRIIQDALAAARD